MNKKQQRRGSRMALKGAVTTSLLLSSTYHIKHKMLLQFISYIFSYRASIGFPSTVFTWVISTLISLNGAIVGSVAKKAQNLEHFS